MGSIGRGRYGTGVAGSLTKLSLLLPSPAVGRSNESRPPAWKYSDRVAARRGGHESNVRHVLLPDSNTVASGCDRVPLSLR